MGSHIGASLEPLGIQDAQMDLMQAAMENLELNPPAEFLENLSWDKNTAAQSSGSAMKYAVPPFPPLNPD